MTGTGDDIAHVIARRYGGRSPGGVPDLGDAASQTLRLLLQHRSVRRFSDEPIGDEHLRLLVAAAQSASSSSHQQCWSVVAVRDTQHVRALVRAGRISDFAERAAAILVFVADWSRAIALARSRGEGTAAVDYLESTLVGFVDAGIAAQNAVIAAESLGLGACFLGSVRNEPEAVADVLKLPRGSAAVAGVALGYPAEEPARSAFDLKPRLPQQLVLHYEEYSPRRAEDLTDFDVVLGEYYDRQQRAVATSWTESVVERTRDSAGLHGRDRMRAALTTRGLPSR